MGNSNQKDNDDFSKNPNFNLANHNAAMSRLNANYTDGGYRVNNQEVHRNVKVTQTEFKQVHRTSSIYKPSITIQAQKGHIKIELEYDSDNGSKLQVYIGVNKIDEHPQSKLTTAISSELMFEQMLESGKKQKWSKDYSLQSYSKISGCTVILRIMSLSNDERTEYSIKNIGSDNWKVLLEKLEFNGIVTQLHNIYKGGNEGDECIICFSETVDTLIEPCNHLCLCYSCSDQVRRSTNTCPICRSIINSFKKIKSSSS